MLRETIKQEWRSLTGKRRAWLVILWLIILLLLWVFTIRDVALER